LLGNGSPAGEPKPLLREHVRLLIQPTFSPDGSKIAYTWIQRDSEWVRMSVYVANADGSSATPLTAADQHGFSPSWIGPKTVGYQVTENNLGSYWVKPLNGAPQQTSLQFDWTNSDDVRVRGTKAVAVLSTSSGKQVVVADLDGGPPVVLTPTSRRITEPCWSQDGHWIAAQELVHGNSNLVVFPSTGGEIQTLVSDPGRSAPYDWTPDSKHVVYTGERDGIWNVYWVDRLTREVRQLTHFSTPSAALSQPAWSPKGDQIVFQRYDQLDNIYIAELR